MLIDEMSVVSPWLLLVIWSCAKQIKFNLVWIGDRKEQKFINDSKYHQQNSLLTELTDVEE
jgi:hypothetical protein